LCQSSNDLFDFLDPESSGYYGSANSGEAWILVEFQTPVEISAVKIQSDSQSFPRSFDLVVTGSDGKIERKEVRNADLNGQDKSERYELRQWSVRSVKIEQKGPNCEGEGFLHFKSLEFFSNSGELSSGVFRSLFSEHRKEIQRFVCVTARDFDLSGVHSISPRNSVCTFDGSREWMEVDFLDHQLFLNSYRLKRVTGSGLRLWSLLGWNDRADDLDKWTKLDSRTEGSKGEFELFQLFPCFGGPFRYYRLVNEGKTWNERNYLFFYHIDLFGVLFPVTCP
jgi:hypothetical protein